MIAHSIPGLPCLFKGAKTVIPAQRRGGHTFSGIDLGIGKAHFAKT